MLPDGIYQWNRVQAYGPSTPMLAQFKFGELVRLDCGTHMTRISELIDHATYITREIEQRITDHARWGAHIEFTPALILSNPVTGTASVQPRTGGAA